MKKIIWSNDFSIGNPDIDIVHKDWINICNDLVECNESKGNREAFAMILTKMTQYSLMHFKREEKYMQKLNYPELSDHKRLHKDYCYKVAMYNIDLFGVNPPSINEVISFIANWLIDHIVKKDKKFEDYKKEIHSDVKY
jgi:hemerythrin